VQEKAATALTELDKVKTKIDEINNTPINPKATILVDSAAIDAKLAEIKQNTSSTHTIYVKEVKESHTGGWIGKLHSGGRTETLPEVLGQDISLASNERLSKLLVGEFVFRPEVTKAWGSLLDIINREKLTPAQFLKRFIDGLFPTLKNAPSFHTGGALAAALPQVSLSPAALFPDFSMPSMTVLHEGGAAADSVGILPPTESMTVRFRAGDKELPLQAAGPPARTRSMVEEFERELAKLRLTHA
jgi:hypothetical protein